MKRKITKIFALLLVCCAFVLAGCGDNSVNVNVDGNYKDTTKEAFSTYVAQIDEAKNLDAKGYKFSMTYKTTINDEAGSKDSMAKELQNNYAFDSETSMNGKILSSEDGEAKNLSASFEIKTRLITDKSTQEVKMNSYIKDGYFYTEMGGIKVKENLNALEGEDSIFQVLSVIPSKEEINSMLKQYAEGGTLDVKVAQSGDTAKYHLTVSIDDKEEGYSVSGDIYYVFKNGKFDGLKIILSSSARGVSIDATIDMISYDGTIDFPSFDEYIETGV